MKSIGEFNSLHFEMVARERIGSDYNISVSEVKLQQKPNYVTYLKSIKPDGERGPELLFYKDENKVILSPNQFPYFNIELEPNSWILRKDHHHTIEVNGFLFLAEVIKNETFKIGEANLPSYVVKNKDVIFRHWNCYHVEINWRNFNWVPYTVKKGESLTSIGKMFHLSDYQILQKNTQYDDFDDATAGDEILIPNHFAKKVVLFVDKVSMLPVYIKIEDEQGVFSEYQYNWLIVDPKLEAIDFSTENPKYNF